MNLGRASSAALVMAALVLVGAADAQATTFCVPNVAAACAGTAGAVSEADVEKAMTLQASDGVADQILIAAGTFTETGAFEPAGGSDAAFEPNGSDPLTIVGAGRSATTLTSAGTTNSYVVNLSFNNARAITVRDLTVQVPTTFPDDLGSAILLYNGDTLESVDVVSLNPESGAVSTGGPGNVFRGGEIRGGGIEGSVFRGLAASNSGTLLAEDVTVRGASWALEASGGGSLTAHRVAVVDARTYGAIASNGQLTVENSTLTLSDGIGLYVSAAATDTVLDADHITVVDTGDTYPAIEGKKFSSTAGDATMLVSNSIFRGFSSGYRTETPFGPGIGAVSLAVRYSNIPQSGTSIGGTASFPVGDVDVDPLLAADLSLPASSPAVDAGDPAAGGLAVDFLGAPRPSDGNGDGLAVRDQGAFEYQRPGTGGGAKNPEPEVVVDRLANTFIASGPGRKLAQGKAKFAFRSDLPNPRFQCKLDRGKVRPCKSPKLYKRLKPGRHVFKVWAIAGFGKDPTPAKKRFRVPA